VVRVNKVKLGALGLGLCAVLGASSDAFAVGTRRVAIRSAEAFAEGELEGVAVDSTGILRAGYDLAEVPVKDATTAWATLDVGGGVLLLATGNDGRLIEYSKAGAKVVADSDAMVLTSLCKGFGGRVFVAALPGGKILEFAQGKLKDWVTLPDDAQIYQLAFDPTSQVLFAATGPEGKLYRIGADAKPQVYFDAPEQHLGSLAISKRGVLAGTGDKAKLYEVNAPGRSRVLYDFGMTEVRAIQVGANGDVFALANDIKSGRSLPSSGSEAAKKTPSSGRGVLYRFENGETPELLLESSDEHLASLSLDARGVPVVGTGEKGRVYTVDAERHAVLLADVDERQVSSVSFGSGGTLVVASDPLVVHPLRGVGGADAVWTSAVLDAGFRARFGRLGWEGKGQVDFETRSGNTKEPDDSWTPWAKPSNAPAKVTSEPARFLQIRARFKSDAAAEVREVNVAFVTDNLKALVTEIEVESTSTESFAEPDDKLAPSGGPIGGKPSDELELSWKVDNADKDELRYRLWYSPLKTGQWFPMFEPNQVWTKPSYTWDTSDLPEGKYRIRVEASDELANAPARVKRHQLESHVVVVDNTAPVIESMAVAGRRATIRVSDGVGPIARVEVSVAGTDVWWPFEPVDGLYDDPTETFELDLATISPTGAALLTVRAYDQENNQVIGEIWLK
jgi:hypothetical protein